MKATDYFELHSSISADTHLILDIAINWEENQYAQRTVSTFVPVEGVSCENTVLLKGCWINNQCLELKGSDGTKGTSKIRNSIITTELAKVCKSRCGMGVFAVFYLDIKSRILFCFSHHIKVNGWWTSAEDNRNNIMVGFA